MLEGQHFAGQPIQFEGGLVRPPWYRNNFYQVLDAMGFAGDAVYCIDPGEVASYDPDTDAQSVLDLTSNGYDFWNGATSGSEATDLHFTGTKGALDRTAYFDIAAGPSYLKIKSMPAELETCHKDGAVFTVVGWWYYISGTQQAFWSTRATSSGSVGIQIITNTVGDQLRLHAGASAMNVGMLAPTPNLWNFIGVSFNEATGDLFCRINDQVSTGSGATFATPTASNAGAMAIGANRVGGNPMLDGTRFGPQSTILAPLTHADIEHIYIASRVRGWLS